jgi:hypothetical protein
VRATWWSCSCTLVTDSMAIVGFICSELENNVDYYIFEKSLMIFTDTITLGVICDEIK